MAERDRPERTLKLRFKSLPFLVALLLLVHLLFPNRNWMILLSGLGGAWLVSYLWARSLRAGLHLEREMRFGWMQVGDRLQEQISLENRGWAPALWVHVIDPSEMGGYEISTVAQVNGRWKRSWYSKGICQVRGVFTLGPTRLDSGDPFGFYQVSVAYSNTANMMVAPRVISIPEVEIAAGGRIGGVQPSTTGMEKTVTASSVREYVPGDSLRWVHWPTTARKDELFVHIYDNEPSSDWWVVLDMDSGVHVGEGQNSTEEVGVILAASIVNRGLEFNKPVGLVSQGQKLVWHPPASGDTQLLKIIRSLADLRTGGSALGGILHQLRSSIGRNVSLVIITPNLSLEWVSALESLQQAGIIPTVILLDPNTFGGRGDLQAVLHQLNRLDAAHYVFTSDLIEPVEEKEDKRKDWWLFYRDRGGAKKRTAWFGSGIRQWVRTLGLVFLVFWALINSIGGGIQGVEDSYLWLLVGSGMLIGWFFTRLRMTAWLFVPLTLLAGILFAMIEVAGMGEELRNAGAAFWRWLAGVYDWVVTQAAKPDAAGLRESLRDIWLNTAALAERMWAWITALVQGEAYFDPIMVAFFWGMMVWIAATWAMWGVFKLRKPLHGLLPSMVLVAITLTNLGQYSNYLALMAGAAIALVAYMNHDDRVQGWVRENLFSDASIQPSMMLYGLGLAAGLIVFSIVTSWFTFKPVSELIDRMRTGEMVDDRAARSLGLEFQQGSTDRDRIAGWMDGGLPNRHLVGAGPELSTQEVMVLEIEGITTNPLEVEQLAPLRYVRGLTYDRYTGSGWVSRDANVRNYDPGDQLFDAIGERQNVLRQLVELTEATRSILFTIGTPLSVDQEFSIAWRLNQEEGRAYDIFGGTLNADTYRADSILPDFTEDDLRNTGQNYPEWVRERYLPLPSAVPERVLTLARELTATELNPYDRAVALEAYLRGFPYTLDVPIPPRDQDFVDYFLFTLEKGYCDYYATAMVVLARAAGMPARLVTGYVAETYDEARQAYVITADLAHSWTEIYFPGVGWVPFEPTAGRQEIARRQPASQAVIPEFDYSLEPLMQPFSEEIFIWLRRIGLLFLGVLVLGLAGVIGIERRFTRQPAERLLPAIFRRVYRVGIRMGVSAHPGDTASEFLARFVQHLETLDRPGRMNSWFDSIQAPLAALTQSYQDYLFRVAGQKDLQKEEIVDHYRQIRLKILLLWGVSRVYDFSLTRLILAKAWNANQYRAAG